MKKILFLAFASVLVLCLTACHGVAPEGGGNGPDVPQTPGGSTSDLVGTITLYTDNAIIKADGEHAAELTVLLMDKSGVEHDVTADVEIYYEGCDQPVASSSFGTDQEGEYIFYAVRGFDISNTVSVRALKGVPSLPDDPDKEGADFHHRMMLVQHTGNECPNCPKLMDILKQLASDEAYSSLYHHVASHSYNTDDNAFSSAAQTLSKNFDVHNYPWLTYNLTAENGYYLNDIKSAVDTYHKDVADVGIAASAVQVGSSIYAQVGIKSAVSSKYRIAVWLLEDSIRSIQSGATAQWHNMHDNCLRAMYGATKNECIYGKPVGTVEAGETCEMIAAIDIEPEWKAENCKLMVIAVAGNGTYDLLNCTVCPVGESVAYDYL